MADEIELGLHVDPQVNVKVTGEAEIRRLTNALQASQAEIDRVNSTLRQTEDELSRVQGEFDRFAHGSGVDILREELERFKSTAQQSVQEFRSFLESVNLNDVYGNNDYQFEELFERIRDGSMTASQAILRVKTEFSALMEENYHANGGLFDSQMVQSFTASLEHLGETITDVVRRLDSIEQNGVKAVDGTGGGSIANVLQQIEAATAGMSEEAKSAYEPITQLVKAMTDYANLDSTRILGVSQAFRNIADIGAGSYGTKSIENIVYLAKQLQALSASGTNSLRFDFTGLNELKVSKASLNNLATYLPQIAKINVTKLQELSQTNLTNFNEIHVSKGSIEAIAQLTEALQILKDTKEATISSSDTSINIDVNGASDAAKDAKVSFQDAKQAVKDYYAALTELARTQNDVTLTSAGWSSASGAFDNLADRLNRTKTAFDMFTDASQRSKFSEEEQVQLLRLMSSEQDKYNAIVERSNYAEAKHRDAESTKEQAAAEKELLADINNIVNAENAYQSALNKINAQRERLMSVRGGVDTEAYANLVNYSVRLQDLLNAFNQTGDINAFRIGMKELNTEYLRNTSSVNEYIKSTKEQAAAEKEAKRSENERISLLREAEVLLKKITKAETNYTAAKTGKSSGNYLYIKDEKVALQDLISQYETGKISAEEFKTRLAALRLEFERNDGAIRACGEATKSWGDRIGGLAQKFGTWFSITRVIMASVRAVRQMVSASIELDDAMTQLQIVTRKSDAVMNDFSDTAAASAKRIGSSITDFVDSATTFSRLGYDLADASKLAEYTAMLQNVGDIDVSDAQDAITAIFKAFTDIDIDNIEQVMDKLVVVGNGFPISVAQIAEGMNNASSTLAAAGNSFEQSVALLTAANTTIQNAAKASTGLRTITARIRNTKTDLDELGEVMTEANYDEIVQQLTKFKVSLTDVNGEYRSTYDIMADIAAKWKDMTSMEQAAMATALAGTRQQAIFYSIIENFEEASGAMDAMTGSAGALRDAYATYMDSATAHINQFKATFQELSKNIIDSGFIKTVVDFGTKILNILNVVAKLISSIGGLNTVLMVTVGIIATIKADTIIAFITNIAGKIKSFGETIYLLGLEFVDAFKAARAAGSSGLGAISAGFKSVTASASAAQLAVGAFVAIISAVVLISNAIQRAEDARREAQESAYNSAMANVQESESVYKLYGAYLDAKKALEDNTGSKEALDKATRALAKALGLEEEAAAGANAELKKLSEEELRKAEYDAKAAVVAAEENLVEIMHTFKDTTEKEFIGWRSMKGIEGFYDYHEVNWNGSREYQAEELLHIYDTLLEERNAAIDAGETETIGYENLIKTIQALEPNVNALREAREAQTDAQERYNAVLNDTATAEEAAASSGDDGSGGGTVLSGLSDTLSKLKTAYDIAKKAQEEMASGGLSADTIASIAKETDDYLKYLYEENGIVKLNTEAWQDYANAKMNQDITGLVSENERLKEQRSEIEENLKKWQEYDDAGNGGKQRLKATKIDEFTKALQENSDALTENERLLGIYSTLYENVTGASDAYSVALSNFDNISNAINGVSDALTTVADLQETVANGFTISLEKALEFASVYPEILNGATVAADGQIALNEDVVNAFIEGKEAELKAQIDAKIAELESEKGVLTAKMNFAQAELDLAKSVGEGEGQISQELAEYRVNAGNAVAQALIEAGIDEATAYQLAMAAMSQNSEEFNRIAAQVCTDVDGNFNSAAYSAAQAIYNNMKNASSSLDGIIRAAHNAAAAIAGIGSGTQAGSTGSFSGSGGTTSGGAKITLSQGTFNGVDYSYTPKTVSLDQFISDLELDISSYSSAIAQIDGQIATLKALRNTSLNKFSSSSKKGGSGSGGSGNKGSGSSSSSKEESWFEQQYKLHQHLLNMDAEEVADYLDWLNDAYQRAYKEGIIDLNDFYKYQEEVYKKLQDLFKDYLNDVEHEIDMRSEFEGESKKIISLYKKLIADVEKEIKAARAAGLDDTDDYIQELQKKWSSYRDSIKDIEDDIKDNAKDAVDELIDIRIKMLKQDIDNEKDAIKKKLDYLKDFYQKQKDMLQEVYDEEKYLEEQSEKRKTVADIQAELAQLEYDNSAWAQKRKLQLAEELADAQKDLDDFERDHALQVAQDELDKLYELQEKELDAQTELLEAKENDAKALYEQALADIKNGSIQLYEEMIEWNNTYGDGISDTIKTAWEEAYKALQDYKDLYGTLYEGVNLANATGYTKPKESWDNAPVSGTNPSNNTSSGSGSGSSKSSGSGSTTSTPKLDDATKRKVAAAIWNGGYGWGHNPDRAKRLTEVFGANNGIQDLVNKGVGKNDAAPGSAYTYLNMRKKFKGYWSGTRKAVAGLHAIDELGTETIFQSADGTKYKMFTGGEKVLNAKASNFLYDFANKGSEILDKIIRSFFGGGIGGITPPMTNNEINMGDIIVHGNADRATVSEIRRAQRESLETMLKELNKLNR